MKESIIIFFTVILFFISSCHQKPSHTNTIASKSIDTTVFYPIADFIKKQIQIVDSTPFFIFKITIRNHKKDSVQIHTKQFDSFAGIFIKYDISDISIKKNYKENVFDDESTNSYTLTYSTKDSAMFIQSADVLLDKETQDVKRIFMTTTEYKNDTLITSKLGWKPDKNFYINKIIDPPNGNEITEQNTIVWDNRP